MGIGIPGIDCCSCGAPKYTYCACHGRVWCKDCFNQHIKDENAKFYNGPPFEAKLPRCSECGSGPEGYHPDAQWLHCLDCDAWFCESPHCRDAHNVTHEKIKARKAQQARYEPLDEFNIGPHCVECGKPTRPYICPRCAGFTCPNCATEHHARCKSHAREFTWRCKDCNKGYYDESPWVCAWCGEKFCLSCIGDHVGREKRPAGEPPPSQQEEAYSPTARCAQCGIYLWRSITGESGKHQCGWCFALLCKSCWATHRPACPARPQPRFTGRRCEECRAQEFSKTGLRGDFEACPLCHKIICPGCKGTHWASHKPGAEFTNRCKECGTPVDDLQSCRYCHQAMLCRRCYGEHLKACAAYVKWQCHTCSKFYPGSGPKPCPCCDKQYCHDCYQRHKAEPKYTCANCGTVFTFHGNREMYGSGENILCSWACFQVFEAREKAQEHEEDILWRCGTCKQKLNRFETAYYTCNNCQGQKFCPKCGDAHHSRVHPHGGFWTHTYGSGERPHTDPFSGFDSIFHDFAFDSFTYANHTFRQQQQDGISMEEFERIFEQVRKSQWEQEEERRKREREAEEQRRQWQENYNRFFRGASSNGHIPEKTAKAFKFLKLSTRATPDEVKRKRKALALKYHPDRGGDVKIMQQINAACDEALEWATAHS